MKNSIFWFIPACTVALGIFLLSTVFAIPIQVEGISGIDKIEHAFAYLVLTFSFLFAFQKARKITIKTALFVVVLSALYGLALEFVQYYFFEYRVFEWRDALANLTGVFIGFGLFKLVYRG